MKGFISYSHEETQLLDNLHEFLSTLRRDGQLATWTDREIHAGGDIDAEMDAANPPKPQDVTIQFWKRETPSPAGMQALENTEEAQ